MRILVHSVVYKPEAIGTGTYTAELCEFLVARGHEVRVVCPPPYYPEWRVQPGYHAWRYQHEQMEGVEIFRCPIYVPPEPAFLNRLLYGLSFLLSSFPVMARMVFWKPQVVFVIEPNFLNSFNALITARLSAAPAWLHIQDFEFDIALAMVPRAKRWIANVAFAVETFVMRRFALLSTISGRMLEHLHKKAVDPARCRMFPNWVDVDRIYPQDPSPMRTALGYQADKLVCMFSGSMGEKHGIEVIVEAARLLTGRQDIEFLICGSGSALPALQARAAGLGNVRFLPLQARSALNDLLSVADVHLLPQRDSAQDLVMPSKLLGMTASGRPVIATVNPGTEVANVVARFGLLTPPGDAAALGRAIVRLADDAVEREALGHAARQYAFDHWSKAKILKQYESELIELTKARV